MKINISSFTSYAGIYRCANTIDSMILDKRYCSFITEYSINFLNRTGFVPHYYTKNDDEVKSIICDLLF